MLLNASFEFKMITCCTWFVLVCKNCVTLFSLQSSDMIVGYHAHVLKGVVVVEYQQCDNPQERDEDGKCTGEEI